MSKITYSVETLYHFNCHNCGGWWTIGDAPKLEKWTCPHCGFSAPALLVAMRAAVITEPIVRPDFSVDYNEYTASDI